MNKEDAHIVTIESEPEDSLEFNPDTSCPWDEILENKKLDEKNDQIVSIRDIYKAGYARGQWDSQQANKENEQSKR